MSLAQSAVRAQRIVFISDVQELHNCTLAGSQKSSVQKSPAQESETRGQRNIVGKRIRAARLKGKPPVSQEDLAARLATRGIYFDRSAISRMEAEKRFVRDYEILAIADCLKVSVAWLFGREK